MFLDMEKLTKQVKSWTLKKMAELFCAWKKRVWSNYQSKKTPPVFEGYLAKQANHWDAFKAYKESQIGRASCRERVCLYV